MIKAFMAENKLIIYSALLVSLLTFFKWFHYTVDQGGYNRAREEMLSKYQDDLNGAMAAKEKQLGEVVITRDKWKQVAIDAQSRPAITVTEYVEKIINTNDCTSINNISELLNKLNEGFTDQGSR